MTDNPTTEDLIKLGWVDFNDIVIIARSEDVLNSYLEKTRHIFVKVYKIEGKKFAICITQDEIEIFQNIIDEMGLYNDVKLLVSEKKELDLNKILDKINENGKDSLTSREYSFLNFIKYLD